MDLSLQRLRSSVKYRLEQRVKLDTSHRAALFSLYAALKPQRATEHTKRRIGESRDGGYVMLDDFEGIKAALSLGVGPDVSWDLAIAQKSIPVWQYDHTVLGPPQSHPLFHFNKQRVVATEPNAGEVTLTSLLEQHSAEPFLLKIDIEGDEWNILAAVPPELLRHCRQIVLEFHEFRFVPDPVWLARAREVLSWLTRDFGVVHLHGNNFAKHIVLEGRRLPNCLEVTMVNRHFYKLGPTDETFPGPLDQRNHLTFPDFRLGSFDFTGSAL